MTVSANAKTTNNAVSATANTETQVPNDPVISKPSGYTGMIDGEFRGYLTTEGNSSTSTYTVVWTYPNGHSVDATANYSVTSSDESIVSCPSTGVLSHNAVGSCTLTFKDKLDSSAPAFTKTAHTYYASIVDVEYEYSTYGTSLGTNIFVRTRPVWTDGTKKHSIYHDSDNFLGYENISMDNGYYMGHNINDTSIGNLSISGSFTPAAIGNTDITTTYTTGWDDCYPKSVSKTINMKVSDAYLVSVKINDAEDYSQPRMFYPGAYAPSMTGVYSDGSERSISATWTTDNAGVTYTEGYSVEVDGVTEGTIITFTGTSNSMPSDGNPTASVQLRYGKWVIQNTFGVTKTDVSSQYSTEASDKKPIYRYQFTVRYMDFTDVYVPATYYYTATDDYVWLPGSPNTQVSASGTLSSSTGIDLRWYDTLNKVTSNNQYYYYDGTSQYLTETY